MVTKLMNDDKNNNDKKAQKDDVRKDIKAEDIPDLDAVIQQLNQAKEELAVVRAEQSNIENQLKRAVADYQNLEKRVSEGRSELTNWVGMNLIGSILPVISHFDQALGSATEGEKNSAWFKGVEMAVKQLKNILKNEGLDEIVADGQFDPTLHEAVDTQDGIDGKILKVVEVGYKIKGKVIKPAKVVVGKKA